MAAFAIAVLLGLLVCFASVALLRPVPDLAEEELREGLYPAPKWFPELLRGLPRTGLTSEQREALQRDGVIVVRGVLQEPTVLHALKSTWQTGDWRVKIGDWSFNGVYRSLVRDGPLGALAASALNASAVRIVSSDVFDNQGGYPGGFVPSGPPQGGLHLDLDSTVGYLLPLLTVWLALTDSDRPVEFLRESHRTNLKHDCPYGPHLDLNHSCISKLLEEAGGERQRLGWDVKAGDALIFFSQLYHRTVLQEKPRTAVSLRFVDSEQRMDFHDDYVSFRLPYMRKPRWCAPLGSSILFPVVHPPEKSTVDEAPWPIWERRVDAACKLLSLILLPKRPPGDYGRKLCPQ